MKRVKRDAKGDEGKVVYEAGADKRGKITQDSTEPSKATGEIGTGKGWSGVGGRGGVGGEIGILGLTTIWRRIPGHMLVREMTAITVEPSIANRTPFVNAFLEYLFVRVSSERGRAMPRRGRDTRATIV